MVLRWCIKMKKGFTLVELLAVMALLAIIAVIAVPSAMKVSYNVKKDMYCEKVDMILQNAKSYGDDHQRELKKTKDGSCYITKTVGFLVEQGLIKKETDNEGSYVLNPVNNDPMDNKKIHLYLKNNRAYAFYEEDDEELKNVCDSIRECASGENETTNNCVKRPTKECT